MICKEIKSSKTKFIPASGPGVLEFSSPTSTPSSGFPAICEFLWEDHGTTGSFSLEKASKIIKSNHWDSLRSKSGGPGAHKSLSPPAASSQRFLHPQELEQEHRPRFSTFRRSRSPSPTPPPELTPVVPPPVVPPPGTREKEEKRGREGLRCMRLLRPRSIWSWV